MSDPSTYRVKCVEVIEREYVVTTPGGEARAAELAQTGDYGLIGGGETVELDEDFDHVFDFRVIEVAET